MVQTTTLQLLPPYRFERKTLNNLLDITELISGSPDPVFLQEQMVHSEGEGRTFTEWLFTNGVKGNLQGWGSS